MIQASPAGLAEAALKESGRLLVDLVLEAEERNVNAVIVYRVSASKAPAQQLCLVSSAARAILNQAQKTS